MSTLDIVILAVVSCFIIWLSWWASIKEKRYHGLFRFFSFESILLLVLNNKSSWFANPFSPMHCLSWMLLIISLIVVYYGFQQLVKRGKPAGKFENTTLLITSGLYHYIRHPLYCSLLLLGTGIWLKNPLNSYSLSLGILNALALFFTARSEEQEMLKRFGDEYRAYMRSSKMFIPFIF
jgi:protein-S-isoprenylcysteine O-methyltransferase Ste14